MIQPKKRKIMTNYYLCPIHISSVNFICFVVGRTVRSILWFFPYAYTAQVESATSCRRQWTLLQPFTRPKRRLRFNAALGFLLNKVLTFSSTSFFILFWNVIMARLVLKFEHNLNLSCLRDNLLT